MRWQVGGEHGGVGLDGQQRSPPAVLFFLIYTATRHGPVIIGDIRPAYVFVIRLSPKRETVE